MAAEEVENYVWHEVFFSWGSLSFIYFDLVSGPCHQRVKIMNYDRKLLFANENHKNSCEVS